jgi:DinB superfamily
MTRRPSGRPQAGEFPDYSQDYIDCVKGDDIEAALSEQLESTLKLLGRIDDHTAETFVYAPGKWTIKEVVGHISDTERVFAYRALRFARHDSTPLPGFEQDDYVPFARSNERSLAELLNEFSLVRQSTIALFRSMPSEAWLVRGTANNQSTTVRGVGFQLGGHEGHHVNILRERYLPKIGA